MNHASMLSVLAELDRLAAQRDDLLTKLWDAEAQLRKFRTDLAVARAERDNARSGSAAPR